MASFGFSLGDVVTCSKLAVSAYSALKSAREDFEGLTLELLSLNTTLKALAEEATSPDSIINLATLQRQKSLQELLENCKNGLLDLDKLVTKYPSLGSGDKQKIIDRIKFAAKSKQAPRDKLAIHTASINIFLTSLTHSSLGRLELALKRALRSAASGGSSVNASRTVDDGFDGAWSAIGEDLRLEGITERQVVMYQEHVKGYLRYLVGGGEPVRVTRIEKTARSNNAEIPQLRIERRAREKKSRQERDIRSTLKSEEADRAKSKDEIAKSKAEEEIARKANEGELRSKEEWAKKGIKIIEVPGPSYSSRSPSRRGLRDEPDDLPVSRGLKDSTDVQSARKPKKNRKQPSPVRVTRASTSMNNSTHALEKADAVEELIGLLDHMFDVNDHTVAAEAIDIPEPLESPVGISASDCEASSGEEVSSSVRDMGEPDLKPNSKEDEEAERYKLKPTLQKTLDDYHEARKRLQGLVSRGKDAQRSGNAGRASDIQLHVIPEVIQRMRDLGAVTVTCDVCDWRVDDVHFHCSICDNGDYDLCEDCYQSGKRCPVKGHQFSRRSAVEESEKNIRKKYSRPGRWT